MRRPLALPHRLVATAIVAAALLAGCTSTGSPTAAPAVSATSPGAPGSASGSTPASTPGSPRSAPTTPAGPLRILVTDDDGVDAEGIDALVEGLRGLDDTEVVVVAPAEDQSGTGGKTTDGPLNVRDTTTASGYPAKAVEGYPADTIVWAVDEGGIDERPHVVISGINIGQNVGPVEDLSGTIGAARAAARRGIPALAASQGIASTPDFPASVELVIEWITEHRTELLRGRTSGSNPRPAAVYNLNVPTCTVGELRELVEVPMATDLEGRDITESDCESRAPEPTDDVDAFIHGYPSLSPLTPAPR